MSDQTNDEIYKFQNGLKAKALHSDFQSHRFIYSNKVDNDVSNDSDKKSIHSNDLSSICSFFKFEMINNEENKDENANLENTAKMIKDKLVKISRRQFKKGEFNQFMAYISILKQIRSAILSNVISNKETSSFEHNIYEYTSTPIESLFQENSSEQKRNRTLNDGIINDFDLILSKYSSYLCKSQKYVNSYAVPICIFNDGNEDYKSEDFWQKYVETLSEKLYLIFLAKAILKLYPDDKNIMNCVDSFIDHIENDDFEDKNKSDDDINEPDEIIVEDEDHGKPNENRLNSDEFGINTKNSKADEKDGNTLDQQTPAGEPTDYAKTEHAYDTKTEHADDAKTEPDDIAKTEPVDDKNEKKEKLAAQKKQKRSQKERKQKEKKNKTNEASQRNGDNNQLKDQNSINSYDIINFIDYSPILSENCVTLKIKPNTEIKYVMKNLSYDISQQLIRYFKNDLNQILRVAEQNNGDISYIYVFEVASSLIEILKIANALLYENGAEIPPLSFIWKQIRNFKSRLRKSIFKIINICIIDKNISYNFATQSFATLTQLQGVAEITKKYITSEKVSIFHWISNENLENDSNMKNEFGVDSVSSIASLIGEKQMNIILADLVHQLENKTNDFCEKYKEYIVNFNFKVEVNSDSHNLYVIKEYLDSFTKYFNLAHSSEIVDCISKIGNIIALIILFDSATASEFISKEMISTSIASKFDEEKYMYLNSSDLSHQRHNYLNIAIQKMNQILNSPSNQIIFQEINGHSAFYQFAISLIYASSHKIIPMQYQYQYQDNASLKNPLIYSSDSISITCSIFLEILSQYDLYAYSNILRAFLVFDESTIDNYDNANEMGGEYIDSYKPKLKSNIQIVDLFHYSLAGFSFQAPNRLIICQETNNLIESNSIKDLLLHHCSQVAILLVSPSKQNKKDLKRIIESSYIEIVGKVILSIKKDYAVDDLEVRIKNSQSNKEFENLNKESRKLIISNIRNLTKQDFGQFMLVIFQKKKLFSPKLIIDKDFLINLQDRFPYIIENENYLTPKKGRIPMPFKSSLSNFFLEKNFEMRNLCSAESIPIISMSDHPKSAKKVISSKELNIDTSKSEKLEDTPEALAFNVPELPQKNLFSSSRRIKTPQPKKD